MPGFTGKIYFGVAGMNKSASSMTGVIRVFGEPASAGSQDGEAVPPSPHLIGNVLRVSDFYVDAEVANEGLPITYLKT